MKVLSRDFTLKEKLLLLLLSLILVGLAYYQFVDRPVREALDIAHAEADALSVELQTVEAKLARMRRMRAELEDVTAGGTASEMGSYNNSKAEIAMLNDVLSEALQYSITFANVTRSGDQIRRNFTLQLTTDSYETMEHIINQINASHYRCLIGDLKISVTRGKTMEEGPINVNATATFFETMVGGVVDAGLPATSAAAS
jgi:Tfp pilus assembly protein PilO